MDTRILSVVTCSKLVLCLRKVKRATVGLTCSGDQIDDKSNHCRNVSLEDKPAISLTFNKSGNRHCASHYHHCHNRQAHRKFIAYHLRTASHCTDKCIFVVTRPACKKDSKHANRRCSYHEEYSNIEVDDLQAISPWKHGKRKHRCHNHQVWCKRKEESVDILKADKLLDENLKHVGKALKHSPGAHTHRTKAALEPCTKFTLIEDIKECKHGVNCKKQHTDYHTFYHCGCPAWHYALEQLVKPIGKYAKIKHIIQFFCFVFVFLFFIP